MTKGTSLGRFDFLLRRAAERAAWVFREVAVMLDPRKVLSDLAHEAGYRTAALEIAAGRACFATAKERLLYPTSLDERAAWDSGYEAAVCSFRLGNDPLVRAHAGVFVEDAGAILRLLESRTPARADPRERVDIRGSHAWRRLRLQQGDVLRIDPLDDEILVSLVSGLARARLLGEASPLPNGVRRVETDRFGLQPVSAVYVPTGWRSGDPIPAGLSDIWR